MLGWVRSSKIELGWAQTRLDRVDPSQSQDKSTGVQVELTKVKLNQYRPT